MEKSSVSVLGTFVGLMGWLLAGVFGFALFLQGRAGDLETFIERHDSLFLSVGVLLLVTSIGLATTYITTKSALDRERAASISADRREKFNQRMQALIKISEFRQAWIEGLREDLAAFQQTFKRLAIHSEGNPDQILQRIRLRLNADEEPTKELESATFALSRFIGDNEPDWDPTELGIALNKFNKSGRRILRLEWARLKNDLENAQTLEESL